MQISKEQFLENNEKLKQELSALNRKEAGVFIDGAFDPSNYYDSELKLLWILKEPYGDPFDYPDFFIKKFDQFFKDLICGVPKHTWGTIAKISDNIFNDYSLELRSKDISTRKSAIQLSLSKIAFININKDSSDTGGRSLTRNVADAKVYYDEFLFKQIKHLSPDVIICGNTFQFLKDKYANPAVIKNIAGEDYVDHYHIDNILFVDPYHPGYLAYGKIDDLAYINDIVRTVKHCIKW